MATISAGVSQSWRDVIAERSSLGERIDERIMLLPELSESCVKSRDYVLKLRPNASVPTAHDGLDEDEAGVETAAVAGYEQYLGVISGAGAAICFAWLSAITNIGSRDYGLDSTSVFYGTSLFGLLSFSLWLLAEREHPAPHGSRLLLCLRGIFSFLGLYCYYVGIVLLPVGEASALNYSSPVFAIPMASALLREFPTHAETFSVFVIIL
eukprot:SAG11_NODE_4014_length_2107_cov_1.057769_3_plen_210_part_00